ncbi:MAG: response regulator [Thermodesulfobacteriota bacterium]
MSHPNPLTILLVDDEEIVRSTLKKVIERLGNHAEEFQDGLAGLEALGRQAYDAAFVDLRMPGIDGIGFLHRAGSIRPQTPIIIISGHGSDETREEALRAGAFAFLTKPFRFDDIRRLLERVRNPQNGQP